MAGLTPPRDLSPRKDSWYSRAFMNMVTAVIQLVAAGRQSLIRNPWVQICFEIRDFLDFRNVIPCMYRILRNIPCKVRESTTSSNTLLFLRPHSNNCTFCAINNSRPFPSLSLSLLPTGVSLTLTDIFTLQLDPKSQNKKLIISMEQSPS
jgi:hypothetical protein